MAWTQALGAQSRQPVSRGAEGLRLRELMRSPGEAHPAENDKRRHYSPFPQLLSVGCNINMQIPWA